MKIDDFGAANLYWARPETKSQGDETGDDIYMAVGIALSEWETLEAIGVRYFNLFVQSYSPAAARAYGSVVSAGGRRDLLAAAAAPCFLLHKVKAEDSKRFEVFIEHWGVASGRRNEIAHGVAVNFTVQHEYKGNFLCPAEYNTKKNKMEKWLTDPKGEIADEFWFAPGVYRYIADDIIHFVERFEFLKGAAYELWLHFVKTYPRMWELSRPPKPRKSDE